jgi:hypothetical protein
LPWASLLRPSGARFKGARFWVSSSPKIIGILVDYWDGEKKRLDLFPGGSPPGKRSSLVCLSRFRLSGCLVRGVLANHGAMVTR